MRGFLFQVKKAVFFEKAFYQIFFYDRPLLQNTCYLFVSCSNIILITALYEEIFIASRIYIVFNL
jgi:hypothetical protein